MRRLHFSIGHIKDIHHDKSRVDAYAFALQIKAMYVSSVLKGKSLSSKNLKSTFGLGDAKLKRCLSDAEKFGYIRRENGLIIACRLYNEYDIIYTLELSKPISHKEIIKKFRHSILLNQINIVQHAGDTEIINEEVRHGKRKTARARRGLAVCSGVANYVGFSFGYDEIAEMMGVSISTAKRDVKELHKSGVIYRRLRFKTYMSRRETSKLSRWEYSALKEAEMRKGKFLYMYNGKIWVRQTNSYGLSKPKNIRIFFEHSRKYNNISSSLSSGEVGGGSNSIVNIIYNGVKAEHPM